MEKEHIRKSKFIENLISISTLADGNCLIHSILKSYHKEYQNNGSIEFRTNLSDKYRKEIAETLSLPNPSYSKFENVSTLVRLEYQTEQPKKFLEFLRMMYNYNSEYIDFPQCLIEYEMNDMKYELDSYRSYLEQYKIYIVEFGKKIKHRSKIIIKKPIPLLPMSSSNNFQNLSIKDIRNIDSIKKSYDKLMNTIYQEIEELKNILHKNLSHYLYLPNHFNAGVIEKVLEYHSRNETIPYEEIPKGKYFKYPFNCYLFTVCKATPLLKFEMEYFNIPEIINLSDIPNHLCSRNFIGDGDALIYIPHILSINLIIIDFDKNSVLAIYENESSDKFVIINSINNVHFETIGLINKSNKIQTLFDKNDKIVIECLKREKNINLNRTTMDKLKEVLGEIASVEPSSIENAYVYIKYRQTSKTVYRFHITEQGELVSGSVPNKILNDIKNKI